MEKSAYDFNLNRSAEIVASRTKLTIHKAKKLLKAGIYFGLGELEDIEEIIIRKENR